MMGDVRMCLRQLRKQLTLHLTQGTAQAASRQGGYTIVEVLIVLTVTTALFISASVMISGRQNRVEFSQAVGDIKTQMQQIINQVGSGYYADTADYANKHCEANGSAIGFSSGSAAKGASTGCIFMGRAVQFGAGTSNQMQKYITYTVAGLFKNDGSMLKANPMLVARAGTGSVVNTTDFPDAGVVETLHSGVRAVKMTYSDTVGGPQYPIGGVAFISSLGDYTTGSLGSGSQQINVFPLLPNGMPVTSSSQNPLATDPTDFVTKADNNMKNMTVADDANPAGGINICLASGGTDQSALMTIGSNGRALTVTTTIKDGTSC